MRGEGDHDHDGAFGFGRVRADGTRRGVERGVWREAGVAGAALPLAVYVVQLVLNAGWSAIFFGLKRPGLAFVEVLGLWLSITLTIVLFWPISTTAALLLVPYLVWVTIATALNFQVWRMNPDGARAGAT